MRSLRLILFLLVLVMAGALVLSCGASSGHQLQSITLVPTSADAQDYSEGQVQFVATGNYKTAPIAVTPLSATWGACYQSSPTNAISVTGTGLAQCASGAVGTYTVWANDPLPASGTYSCPASNACGGGCTIEATAQLTCP